MQIIDLTLELADGTQTHPAHARCVVIEFASYDAALTYARSPEYAAAAIPWSLSHSATRCVSAIVRQ